MKEKIKTVWLVTYRFKGTNKIMGLIWEVPSKIKPTQWALKAFEGDFDITYENTGLTEEQYNANKDE